MVSLRTLQAAVQEQGRMSAPSPLPAPVLGWNTRDAIDAKLPGYAEILDNWFPYNGYCLLRGGSIRWADGLGGPCETLAYYNTVSGSKVIAGAGGQLWDVENGSKASIKAGFTSNRWQWDMTRGSRSTATPYLYLVNGTDTPQAYNGTTSADVTWTAASGQPTLNPNDFTNVHIAKDLIFACEKGQLGFWHSEKGSVAPDSTFSWFDLGTILAGGGELVAVATMTMEGGEGPDDYIAFVASTGQTALYSGNDPSQATDWALVGRFPLGQTLGRRCVLEIAGDIIVLTVNGYISLRQFIQIGGLLRQSYAFNDNIQPTVVTETLNNKNFFGWQPLLVPELTLALFNVPQTSDGTSYIQHVVNTQTAAWASVSGWNGICWLATADDLLFGTAAGEVFSGNVGGVDFGNRAVVGTALTAFNDFGSRGNKKQFHLVQPLLDTIGNVAVSVALATDYNRDVITPPTASLPTAEAGEWNTAQWDQAVWEGAPVIRTDWYGVPTEGYSAALYLSATSTGVRCQWKSSAVTYTVGGVL